MNIASQIEMAPLCRERIESGQPIVAALLYIVYCTQPLQWMKANTVWTMCLPTDPPCLPTIWIKKIFFYDCEKRNRISSRALLSTLNSFYRHEESIPCLLFWAALCPPVSYFVAVIGMDASSPAGLSTPDCGSKHESPRKWVCALLAEGKVW